MANSITPIIPEAVLCYQQLRKDVLMHCLHAQLHPLPAPTEIKDAVDGGWGWGVWGELHRVIRDQRGLVSAGRHAAVSHLPSSQGSCCHSNKESGPNIMCKQGVNHVFSFSQQNQNNI